MADLSLVVVPALLIGLVVPSGHGADVLLGLGTAVTVVLVQLVLQARRGWTVGQWAVGLRLVDHETGEPVGIDRALLRALVVAVGSLAFVVGGLVVLASPLFDKSGRRRGWHDEVIDADVIYLPEGRPADRPKTATKVTGLAAPEVAPAAPVVGVQPGGEDAPVLAFGLMPELERTRRSAARTDVAWDDEETYRPMTADLELSDGSAHEVQGVVLVGRNPIAGPGQTGLRLADRERSVSRTHLRLTVGPIAVWVEDLDTVNGTVVHLPDGTEEACEPGRPVQLPVGSVVSIGDAWIRLGAVSGEPVFPESTSKR
ncbi:MAG: RDD family protein [Micrococcales bacterium]|nr:RDD family protein [Micrococcales bacterium]